MEFLDKLKGLIIDFSSLDHFHAVILLCMEALIIVGLALIVVYYSLKKRG